MLSNAPADAPKIVEALIAHPAIRRINFTGSTKVGRIVAKLAAEHLKPVLLELGGKAPLVVLDDADLDQAVDAAAFGAFMNQGQICMSTERIIVDQKVADAFVTKLAAKAAKLPAGDPRGHVVLGSLVDPLFGRDVTRALAVAKRVHSGICHINGPTVADEAQMPFGGMKASGYGRFGGKAVINEFTDLRWITIEGPQHYPF